MSITKSIVTGSRPAAIRGGRLRKRGNQVVSFAPHFADLLSGASRVALGGVLILTGVAALAPTSAMAAPCASDPDVITLCSGPASPTGDDAPYNITVSQPGTSIETAEGFGVDSSNDYSGPAISLSATDDADILFTDDNQSTITGYSAGIYATNYGSGDTSISVSGAVTGTESGSFGISIYGPGSGNASITTTATSAITAGSNAVDVFKLADGDITIDTAGTISTQNGTSVAAYSGGSGDITITNSASLSGGGVGISALKGSHADLGTGGDITITNSGTIDSDFGIEAIHYGTGDITLTTTADSEITGKYNGINAWHYGEGDITVTTAGTITSTDDDAINAWSDGAGDISVNNSATLDAADHGIVAFIDAPDDAEGNVTVTNSGDIFSSNVGIAGLSTANGTVSITNTADIESRNEAIRAWHVGAGDIVVDNSGDLTSDNSFGISTFTDDAGNITVTNSNLIEAQTGINAIHNGTGTLTVTTEDDSVINAAVSDPELGTGGNGVNAWHYGDGDVVVTTSGSITSEDDDAINAYTNGTGNISVTNNAVLNAADYGIIAFNNAADGTAGNITITNNGAITSGNVGIAGLSTADGNVTITNTADIESQNESIRAWHVGAGDITVTNSGDLTSTDDFGISAFTDASGNITSTNSGEINADIGMHAQHDADGLNSQTNNGTINAVVGINSVATGTADIVAANGVDGIINSSQTSIFASHSNAGNITISNAGTVNNTSDLNDLANANQDRHALYALHTGTGDISISNSGTVNALLTPNSDINVYGYSHGIIADHQGSGNILIDNSGTINAAYDGIAADHIGDGDITITNSGTINAEDDGIFATHEGNYLTADESATISITNDAAINAGGDGIVAIVSNNSYTPNYVNVDITNNGTITSDNESINVDIRGDYSYGDVTVINTGTITSTDDDAIIVEHDGVGDVTVNNSGTINAYFDAIDLDHDNLGNLIVITQASSVLNAEDNGIEANHSGDGDIEITNAGKIYADYNGIDADHSGDGKIDITNSGTINANYNGINAYHDGYGAIDIINTGTINADYNGIDAYHDGLGSINVTNGGTITAENNGIIGFHEGEGDINITTTATSIINGAEAAIAAEHEGFGNITITNAAGAKLNNVDVGIATRHEGEGDITVTNNGALNASRVGIGAIHEGEGNIAITNNAAITGASQGGIYALHLGEGDVTITNTGNVSGGNGALAALAEQGNIVITNSGTLANSSGNSADAAIIAVTDQRNGPNTVSITNSGTITGTITTGFTGSEYDEILEQYVSVEISGNDTLTNDGTWNTAGGTNDFNGGDDIVINNGTVRGANASFVGLENFTNNGTLTLANNVAGDTLTTDGNMSFGEDSKLIVDIGGNNIDQVIADGDIILDGAELELVGAGARATAARYTILSANNIDGQFAADNVQDTAFLDLELDYADPTRVDLTITKVVDFADVAQTPNQLAVAETLDPLAAGNALIDELLYLPSADAARTAFDQLSGEVHATQHTAMADDSRLPRNAVLNRLQNQDGSTIWGELFFGTGDLDQAKHRNTGSSKRDAWGFILGADAAISDNVVVGLAGSLIKHESDNQLRSTLTNSEIETAHLLAYVGAESGKARFKLGAGYAWGDVTTARTVNFGRFTDRLTADYDAKMFQAFAELGYRLPLGGGYVEPMANVIYIDTTTDAFTENGGLAALSAEKRSENTTLSTLGARFSTPQAGIFSLNGMVGWQHGFGKLTPNSVMSFASYAGSDSFTIAGAPQSRDAAVMQVEAKLDAGSGMSVGLGYDGILGTAGHDHAAKISVRMKF
ncbi:autotransporter domain-containing protein [Sphingopyxis yananensis]|uniref:autotransporter domain-containing protein n=1 Tax=Sphingopyxis yananensis TaxID=2886687 RepID=UPI001D109BA1|nr:autotransporter domain-containing protein [Sphingopyxis yananensis]MCC2602097.1 autotransporter domain-containing protein [Sphingopyxis yananensis]